MIADYLRPYAQWRINRPDPCDDGRNARAAIGLIDAAAYVTGLDDSERVIVRMAIAGCFTLGRFNPGAEGRRSSGSGTTTTPPAARPTSCGPWRTAPNAACGPRCRVRAKPRAPWRDPPPQGNQAIAC
ncbi:hypothetical protein ACFQY7_24950 [Actinomadura luteofluorescens]|uniref:hypothetical protein n=1 Tax=Actinomadura luteofluorescens TaxID=46163 RepID=UPI003629D0EF